MDGSDGSDGGSGEKTLLPVERWCFPPAALARTSLVLWRMEPPPEWKEHGAPRPNPRAGQRPAPRGNCLLQFPVCVETTGAPAERWSFSLTSRVRSCSARCPSRPGRPSRPGLFAVKKTGLVFTFSGLHQPRSDFHSESSRKTYFISFPTS